VRIVLCDEDPVLRDMVESLVTRLGFEVVGIADTTVSGVHLIEAAHPDAVIFDMTLGYNTDFDVIDTAQSMGVRVVVFSHNADENVLARYEHHPTVVHKPDLGALEHVLSRMQVDAAAGTVVDKDRRQRPAREASGPPSTGVADAQAFYEALNDLAAGDGLVSLEVAGDAGDLAHDVVPLMRGTDRLLASVGAVRVFLPGGGDEGIASFLARLDAASVTPTGSSARSIVATPGEDGSAAFDRLRHSDPRPI
jgi:CheY-like chemotaxis protein